MKQLISFFKKLRIGQLLTVFIAGIALFLTTACNSGDIRGARPNNPPVQMGGQNNPHKQGGDGYNAYKQSTDPKVNRATGTGDRASLVNFNQLLASNGVQSNGANDLLYPGTNATGSRNPDFGPRHDEFVQDAVEIPAQPQRIVDRSNPDEKILEKTGQAFEEASEFIKDTFEDVDENPAPYQMRNPALGK